MVSSNSTLKYHLFGSFSFCCCVLIISNHNCQMLSRLGLETGSGVSINSRSKNDNENLELDQLTISSQRRSHIRNLIGSEKQIRRETRTMEIPDKHHGCCSQGCIKSQLACFSGFCGCLTCSTRFCREHPWYVLCTLHQSRK